MVLKQWPAVSCPDPYFSLAGSQNCVIDNEKSMTDYVEFSTYWPLGKNLS